MILTCNLSSHGDDLLERTLTKIDKNEGLRKVEIVYLYPRVLDSLTNRKERHSGTYGPFSLIVQNAQFTSVEG